MTYYPETKYEVMTQNPELLPHLSVYEVSHGCFNTVTDAKEAALPLLRDGRNVQIVKRYWTEIKRDLEWINADHYVTRDAGM
jgi:hypothetical protein